MLRRSFLQSLGAFAALAVLKAAPRAKISDVRIVNLKVVRETGTMKPAWSFGGPSTYRIGGGSILELHTDQGVTGIGPGLSAGSLDQVKALLVGKDPFGSCDGLFRNRQGCRCQARRHSGAFAVWESGVVAMA